MKPFNLEQAKAGKPVVTREGRDVRILAFDRKSEGNIWPLLGLINLDRGIEELGTWNIDGFAWMSDKKNKDDLFMKSEKKEGWINLYRDNRGLVFPGVVCATEAESKSKIAPATDYITTIKVEWEE